MLLSGDPSHPVPQAIAMAAVGLACLCFRRYRTAAAFVTAGLCWVLLCATPAFAQLLQRRLESRYPQQPAASYPTADAIVVLGGGDPMPSLDVRNGNDPSLGANRTGFGLELFRAGKAPVIFLSGRDRGAVAMAQELEKRGVPARSMRLETRSATTHENALFSAAILKREHRLRILLVTSPWAMTRAAACFRKEGIEVIPAPTLEKISGSSYRASWWPQRVSLRHSDSFLHEYFGSLYYWLRGWT